MPTLIAPPPTAIPRLESPPIPAPDPDRLSDAALKFLAMPDTENTQRAYRSDWRMFSAWCIANNRDALPSTPNTVASYIAAMAENGLKISTISRHLSAISAQHRKADMPVPPTTDPLVREVLGKITRSIGSATKKARPLLLSDMHKLVDALPTDAQGMRDRAMLLVGWATAMRSCEIAAMRVEHLKWEPEGLLVVIPFSKTDKIGQTREVAIPYVNAMGANYDPIEALKAWLIELGSPTSGPIWRRMRWVSDPFANDGRALQPRAEGLNAQSVWIAVKNAVRGAGLPYEYSAHSLRSGLATWANGQGWAEADIMAHTGHQSQEVFRGYVRHGNKFSRCPLGEKK